MLHSVELKDHMHIDPVTVKASDSIYKAIDYIVEHKVSGVCVVDDKGCLQGILSEIDCLKAVLSATYNTGGVGAVAEFMTPKERLAVADINDDIVETAADMLKKSHRRRPVVENGKLVGQITCRRLLRAMSEFAGANSQAS